MRAEQASLFAPRNRMAPSTARLESVGLAGSATAAISAPYAVADPDGLRPYQREAVTAAMEFTRAHGWNEGVIRLHTGSGKTKTGAVLVKEWLREHPADVALWVVPRIFLGDEARRRLASELGEPVALERAEYKALGAVACQATRVVVGSMQTMKDTRLSSWDPSTFGLIVWDECQTWDSEAAQALKKRFPRAKIVGLSATPTSGKIIISRDVLWGMEEGYFVRPVPRERTLKGLDLSGLKSRRNSDGRMDLPAGEIEKKIAGQAAFIVEAINAEGADRHHRMTYTPGVASAHAVAAFLNDLAPGTAVSCDRNTPQIERDRQLRAFDRGEVRDIVNCKIYGYGLDVPKCDMITIAYPTEDPGWYQQMVGRGGRPEPGIGELPTRDERLAAIAASSKPNFLLLDLTGEAGKHSLCSAVDLDDSASAVAKARAREAIRKEPGMNVYDALKDAKAWERGENIRIAKLAREMKVSSAGGPFDPFRASGIGNRDAYNRLANKFPEPATDAQRWWLRANGLPTDISKGEAMRLRAREEEWKAAGRATMSQRAALNRLGLPHDLTWKQAADLLFECGPNKNMVPPRGVVERIVSGERTPGEEG